MSKQIDVNWIKADKPYPKKSAPVSSVFSFQSNQIKKPPPDKTSNPFSVLENINSTYGNNTNNSNSNNNMNQDSSQESKNSDDSKSGKLTIKDLCPEDKHRIANLIKELAKIAEEKKQIENALEEERKQKENEIKEVLKQQEVLLAEKESLIKNFSKIQNKLIELQLKQKQQKQLETMKTENKLPPRPNNQKQQQQQKLNNNQAIVVENKPKLNEEQKLNDGFSPFKSSTPKNLSPRSLSPISIEGSNKNILINENKNDLVLNEARSEDDLKKINLIKESMELAEEQKKLKLLLEKQEDILKEKQAEIMVQQKLHLERLEELNRIKSENQQFILPHNLVQNLDNQQTQHLMNSQIVPIHVMNQIPSMANQPHMNNLPYQSVNQMIPFNVQNKIVANNEQLNPLINHPEAQNQPRELNEDCLEDLATIIYRKMMLKKKSEKLKINKQAKTEKNLEKPKSNNNDTSVCSNSNQQENDEYLVDLIIEETKSISSLNKTSRKKQKPEFKTTENQQDLEESKLIEDLFFIK